MERMIDARKQTRGKTTIGMLLLELYIFTSYVAQDILIPAKVNSFFLYLFLAGGVATFVLSSRVKISRFTVWYALFTLVSFLTLTYSPEPILPLGSSMYIVLVTLALTTFMQMFITDEAAYYRMMCVYAVSSAAFVFLLIVTGNLTTQSGIRLGQDIVGNANTFAMMMMVALMYEAWIFVYVKLKPIWRFLLLLGMALCMTALLMSGGRKYILVPIVFVYILLLLRRDRRGQRKIIIYTVIIAAVAGSLFYAMMKIPALYEVAGSRMIGLLNAVTGEGQVDTSTALRDKMRVLAISGWLERPLIGHGFDSYKYLNADVYGRFYYSHCNYTELLYNGGIITLAVYYWMPVSILRQAFLQKKIDLKYRAFAIAAVLSLLAFDYGAVDYNVTSIVIMFMMAYVGLSIGKAQADVEEKRKQNEKKRRPRPSEVTTHE